MASFLLDLHLHGVNQEYMHRILEHRADYNLGTVEHVHQQRPK